jgi:hypothetical protein
MRRIIIALLALLTALGGISLIVGQSASAASKTSLKCFGTESGSECIANKDGSFTLVNGAGEYSGVYIPGQRLAGKAFATVSQLRFNYDGDISGGSPRFTLPIIDSTGRDGWVFIDASSCNIADNTSSPSSGLVSPLVDPSCAVSGYVWNADNTTEGFYYGSWQDFLAGIGGSAVIGSNTPFLIADQGGTVSVSNVVFGAGKK